jgi:hypothetical protein
VALILNRCGEGITEKFQPLLGLQGRVHQSSYPSTCGKESHLKIEVLGMPA